MKISIFLKTILLSLLNITMNPVLYAQFSGDADGKLSVSPLNGTLNYNYPISNHTIDGYSLNVNLNYT